MVVSLCWTHSHRVITKISAAVKNKIFYMMNFYCDVLKKHMHLHNVICKRENTSSGKIKFSIEINFLRGSIILTGTVKQIIFGF